MAVAYYIKLYDRSGSYLGIIDDFWRLDYTPTVNAPGVMKLKMDGNHAKLGLFTADIIGEVWRSNFALGIAEYCDFVGIYKSPLLETGKDGKETFTATFYGLLKKLEDAAIQWRDGVENRSVFTETPTETAMKTLVKYNVVPAYATVANGRLCDFTGTSGITVASDLGSGDNFSGTCQGKNLLAQLQEIAKSAGGDFDLINTGLGTYEFRYYISQRGTDRTDSVTFALERGNMTDVKYEYDRSSEATFCVVGSQGEGDQVIYAGVEGANYSTEDNYREMSVSCTDTTDTTVLVSAGLAALYQAQAKEVLSFGVLQVPSCLYGKHYFAGDKVTSLYKGRSIVQKIWSVSVSVEPNSKTIETIKPELRNA